MDTENSGNSIPWKEIEKVFNEVWKPESNAITKRQLKEIEEKIERKETLEIKKTEEGMHHFDGPAVQNAFEIICTLSGLVLSIISIIQMKKSSIIESDIKKCVEQLLEKDEAVKVVIKPRKVDKLSKAIYLALSNQESGE